MNSSPNLDQLTAEQLRALAAQLLTQVDVMGKKIHRDQTIIEQLTHEIAWYKRHKFAKRSEQLSPGSPPFSRTLTRRPIKAMRSVHVEAKEVQHRVQARCG